MAVAGCGAGEAVDGAEALAPVEGDLYFPAVLRVAGAVVAAHAEANHLARRADREGDPAFGGGDVQPGVLEAGLLRVEVGVDELLALHVRVEAALDGDRSFGRAGAEGDRVPALRQSRKGALGVLDVVAQPKCL